MKSWEDAILDRQESEAEMCKGCKYAGVNCNNQCEEIHEIANPNLAKLLREYKRK